MKRFLLYILGGLSCIISLIETIFFNIYTFSFPPTNLVEFFSEFRQIIPFLLFWHIIGFLLNITSSYYLSHSYRKKSLIFGILGTFLIIITFSGLYFVYYSIDRILFLNYPTYYPKFHCYTLINNYLIFTILMAIILISVYIALCIFNYISPNLHDEKIVRKIILNSEHKFTRTEINELSEKSRIDMDSIIEITLRMIKNQELKAIYFDVTKSIAFIHESQIDGLDDLMKKYRKWEEQKVEKYEILRK